MKNVYFTASKTRPKGLFGLDGPHMSLAYTVMHCETLGWGPTPRDKFHMRDEILTSMHRKIERMKISQNACDNLF